MQARSRFWANPKICRRVLPPPSGHFAVGGHLDMLAKQKGAPRWGALDWRSAKIIRQVVTALWGVWKNAGGSGAAPRQPLQIAPFPASTMTEQKTFWILRTTAKLPSKQRYHI